MCIRDSSLAASAVTVYAPPVAPTNATNASQCGTPLYTATSALSGNVTYKWYTAATGGSPIKTDINNSGSSIDTLLGYVAGNNTLYAVSYTHLDVYKRQLYWR